MNNLSIINCLTAAAGHRPDGELPIREKKGFTLIELLIVIVVISIIAGVASSIFISVVRSNNKANIINEVQQNANFIFQTLEGSLRNARAVTTPSVTGVQSQTLTFLDQNNETVSYRFDSGAVQKQIGSSWENLSNTNSISGVNADSINSYFELLSHTPPALKIVLVVKQGANAPGRIDYQASTTFETTVSLRDY